MSLAWGGHKNGQIPASALVTVRGEGFEREAGRQVVALGAAFLPEFDKPLIINDGYRPLWEQILNWNKWVAYRAYLNGGPWAPWAPLAAYYGTSNHGWGRAADFGSRVNVFGSAEKEWMDANAPKYGWHPTGNRFSTPEPWHFDYLGNPTIVAGDDFEIITEERELDMKETRYLWTKDAGDGKPAYGIFGAEVRGGSRITRAVPTAEVWGAIWGEEDGAPWMEMSKAQWPRLIAEAKVIHEDHIALQREITGAVSFDYDKLAQALANVVVGSVAPTATEIAKAVNDDMHRRTEE